uniref:Uncharacterized protein n=1 Tax=Meloidogyne enterolobii TaxID=390850 RepID=A0A6V7XPN3_MELEN|nr:unnamed protein product [Meloidogyne enterolobii]
MELLLPDHLMCCFHLIGRGSKSKALKNFWPNYSFRSKLRIGRFICHSKELGELSRMTSKFFSGKNSEPRYRARNGQKSKEG